MKKIQGLENISSNRNAIPGFRSQDEKPFLNTQTLRPEDVGERFVTFTCPACCGSTGIETIQKGHRNHFTPCARCKGKGVV